MKLQYLWYLLKPGWSGNKKYFYFVYSKLHFTLKPCHVADKSNWGKDINGTFWTSWSKFHKTDNPEDAKSVLLEVSSLWNSKQIVAATKKL